MATVTAADFECSLSTVSVFGLLLIARRIVDWRAGAVLLGLFVVHLFFPSAQHRLWITLAYFGLAALLVILDWRRVRSLFREELQDLA